MGDFDRKEKKAGSDQTKQIGIMIALGAVLIGVVGYHFSKGGGGPAPVQAGAIPMPVIDETPEQASNALKQDPTASLLRETQDVDTSFGKTPPNPFLMGEAWRSSLVAVPIANPERVVELPPNTGQNPTRIRIIPAPKAENFKLASIVRQGGSLSAIINGRIVGVGAVVGDARVIAITEAGVVLQNAESSNGAKLELTLDSKFK